MSNLECFSCERRAVCEPIIENTVVGVALASIESFENAESEYDINPMNAIAMMKLLGQIANAGDLSGLHESAKGIDFTGVPDATDLMNVGFNRLREAGCSLDDQSYGIRLIQYMNGNFVTVLSRITEEEMVRNLGQDVDILSTDDTSLKNVLGNAGIELSSSLNEFDDLASVDPELRGGLGKTMSELGSVLDEIRGLVGEPEVDYSLPDRPIMNHQTALEDQKIVERARFIESQGWDQDNLNFTQKLEIKDHLREQGYIR